MKFNMFLLLLMLLFCQCNHDEVELDCSKATIILDPFNCELNEKFAICTQLEGNYSFALNLYKKCLQNCDTNFSLLMYTGDCLFKLDSAQQAEFFLLRHIK